MQSNAPSGLTAALPSRRALDWSVCIPTLNRVDVLELALKCILSQTHLPREVVVVDASDDWEGHRDRLAPLFDGTPIDFALLPAEETHRRRVFQDVERDVVGDTGDHLSKSL